MQLNIPIPTLFILKDNLYTPNLNPECKWVMEGEGRPTRMREGNDVSVVISPAGHFYSIWRENDDPKSKARWRPCGHKIPVDRPIWEAVYAMDFHEWPAGEWPCVALGPKFSPNEHVGSSLYSFVLFPEVLDYMPRTFEGIREYLRTHPMKGIVWQDPGNNRYAKVERKSFGLSWGS